MIRTRHAFPNPSAARRCLLLAACLAAPIAHAQSNAPVTGSMLQETPDQRARLEEAARQAEAARRAQAARPASSVVRQVPGPAAPAAAPAQAQAPAQAPRGNGQRVPEQRVTTVVAPPAAATAPPAAPPAARVSAMADAETDADLLVDDDAPSRRRPVGDATRDVLRMQIEGRQAGQALPMLGATAAPSWKRYVDSFSRPIPAFYETTSQPK